MFPCFMGYDKMYAKRQVTAMTKGYEQRKVSNEKYLAKFDDIKLRVPKGRKEELKKTVAECGYDSLNSFIIDAIEHYAASILKKP